MNEIEPNANEPTTEESAVVERSNVGIDLATRPDGEWLNTVQNELNDTDLVLKCLARDSAKMCQTCDVCPVGWRARRTGPCWLVAPAPNNRAEPPNSLTLGASERESASMCLPVGGNVAGLARFAAGAS